MAQQLCWHSTFIIDYYFHFFKIFFWVIFLISLISLINWSSNIKLLSYLLIFVITFWEHFLTFSSIFFNVTLALSNWKTLTFCYSFIYFQLISRKVKIGSISWKQYISCCYTSYIHVLLHKRGRVHFITFVTVSRLQNKYLHLNK